MKAKPTFLCLLLALTTILPLQSQAAEGPPVVSPPPELVLGDYFEPGSALNTAFISLAVDEASGKLFVTTTDSILRFSPVAQTTKGGLPEAVFTVSGVSGIAVDAAGHLWAAIGNRVFRYDNALFREDAQAPDAVLGQPDLTSNTPAAGQEGMNAPKSLALDSEGTLWVADTGNNRVIGFLNAAGKTDGAPADLLLGQPNWTNTGMGVAAGRMNKPLGLAADSTGRLWVVDNGPGPALRRGVLKISWSSGRWRSGPQ